MIILQPPHTKIYIYSRNTVAPPTDMLIMPYLGTDREDAILKSKLVFT